MRAEVVMAIVVIPFDGRVFNRAVHALDLSVRPRVVWLGQAMLNAICSANHVKPHGPGIGGVPVAGLLTKLDAVVRKDCVHLVWERLPTRSLETPRPSCGLLCRPAAQRQTC